MANLELRATLERLHGDIHTKLNDMVDAFLDDINTEFEEISDMGEDGVFDQPHEPTFVNNLEFADLDQLTWLLTESLRRLGMDGHITINIGVHGAQCDQELVQQAMGILSQIGGEEQFYLGYSEGEGPWAHWLSHKRTMSSEGGDYSVNYDVYGPLRYTEEEIPVPQREVFKPFLPKNPTD